MIKLDDTLLAIWFIHVSPTNNWAHMINRQLDGTLLHQWRMRHFPIDSGLFDKDEESTWYKSVQRQAPPNEAVDTIRTVVRILSEHADGPIFELIRAGKSDRDFQRELIMQPWIHFRPAGNSTFDVTFKLRPVA